nr:hypothetical protein [Tanacetum cinerariifolium]
MEECHLLLTDQIDLVNPKDHRVVPDVSKPLPLGGPPGQAVIYRDRNDQKKMMRETEVQKLSDGTLTKILEKLDHMVKDFKLFKYNPGMETRNWSEDDKRRSKELMEVNERRLKIRRILRSLKSFVSGSLPPEWSKFVTDVKLVKDLHTANFDQLYAYLEQHKFHANEVCLMRECNQDSLALVMNHQMSPPHFNTYQSSYNNPQFQQQFSPSQSHHYGSTHPTQHYSTTYPSTPHAITYLSVPYSHDYSLTAH